MLRACLRKLFAGDLIKETVGWAAYIPSFAVRLQRMGYPSISDLLVDTCLEADAIVQMLVFVGDARYGAGYWFNSVGALEGEHPAGVLGR
jgi:hypothetical protein